MKIKIIKEKKKNDTNIAVEFVLEIYDSLMEKLSKSYDSFMKKLVVKNANYINFYLGDNLDIIGLAIEKGYKPLKIKLKDNWKLCRNDDLMFKLIIQDISYFKLYEGNNPTIINLAIEKNYKIPKKALKNNWNLRENDELMIYLIKKDVTYFEYYKGKNNAVINLAIEKGYKITKKDLENNWDLRENDELMIYLIKKDVTYFEYYEGKNNAVINLAIEKGYKITKEDLENNWNLRENDELMIYLIKKDVTYFEYYEGKNNAVINLAIEKGYKITKKDLENNWDLRENDELMIYLIKKDVTYFEYYEGKNNAVINLAIEKGYKITKKDLEKRCNFRRNDELMIYLIKKDVTYFEYYEGNDQNIMDYVASKGYIPSQRELEKNPNICLNSNLMQNVIEKNINYIKYYKGDNPNLYIYALNRGCKCLFKDIYTNETFARLIDEDILNKFIIEEKTLVLIQLCNDPDMTEYIKRKIVELRFNNVPIKLIEVLNHYNGDKLELINSIEDVMYFLSKIGITLDDYIKTALANSYDWLKDIKLLVKNNQVDIFCDVISYFKKNYYMLSDNDNKIVLVDSVNDLLKNYIKYPELIISISKMNRDLTNSERNKLNTLFITNTKFNNENRPKRLEELDKLDEVLKNIFIKKINNVNTNNIVEMKILLCEILFNKTPEIIHTNFIIYGDTKNLRQLKFNNRDNEKLSKLIDEIMIYTTIMESIILLDDGDKLRKLIKKIEQNLDLTIECSKIFNNYEKRLKEIYEQDIIENLTKINEISSYENILDKELTKKYGVDVIDFSKKAYTLIAHVKSDSETIEELVEGSSQNKLFISTTPISYRNQVYYYNRIDRTIFATDEFPKNNFICSSIENMGTNSKIKNYSTEMKKNDNRNQRGILEISASITGNNAEVFSLREGIKFKYIVLVGGRKPSEEEIELAKKYNLRFIITQDSKSMIKNPEKLEYKKETSSIEVKEEIEKLKVLRNKILEINKIKKERKVAILTDLHGLFEPTLAILEDVRKNGITEIYSLGDNIGTGPNPKEVLELLDEYNVKSIVGNHELYVLNGVDSMYNHLKTREAYEEAFKNSSWTRNNLTQKQLNDISEYPNKIELLIGGKKILLCHSIKDYNTKEMVANVDEYDEIFQGHIHFEGQEGKVTTVRGAGIGGKSNDVGHAFYLTITEKVDGGYTVERHLISYDINSLKHDVNISDAPSSDKNKINYWTGVKR